MLIEFNNQWQNLKTRNKCFSARASYKWPIFSIDLSIKYFMYTNLKQMTIKENTRAVVRLVSEMFLRLIALIQIHRSFCHRYCLKYLIIYMKSYCYFSSTVLKQQSKINQTGSVHDIEQRPRSCVATRGKNRSIFLNHLRIIWN